MGDFEPSATVIADSTCNGHRLTTMEVKFHRFMLSAFNTHRSLSRNSASSRAIPVAKTMQRLADEPAIPLLWPGEKKGMVGGPPLRSEDAEHARDIWLSARDEAVRHAEQLVSLGVHKSVANRLLEPFMSHTVVVTATNWDNFYAQRTAPQDGTTALAQAEIVAAATAMYDAHQASKPEPLTLGQWHLPYIADWELKSMPTQQAIQVSVARCARTSYLTQNGKRDPAEDIALYQRLVTASPPHWSPLEHVATPAMNHEHVRGNYSPGWHQLRHCLARS